MRTESAPIPSDSKTVACRLEGHLTFHPVLMMHCTEEGLQLPYKKDVQLAAVLSIKLPKLAVANPRLIQMILALIMKIAAMPNLRIEAVMQWELALLLI